MSGTVYAALNDSAIVPDGLDLAAHGGDPGVVESRSAHQFDQVGKAGAYVAYFAPPADNDGSHLLAARLTAHLPEDGFITFTAAAAFTPGSGTIRFGDARDADPAIEDDQPIPWRDYALPIAAGDVVFDWAVTVNTNLGEASANRFWLTKIRLYVPDPDDYADTTPYGQGAYAAGGLKDPRVDVRAAAIGEAYTDGHGQELPNQGTANFGFVRGDTNTYREQRYTHLASYEDATTVPATARSELYFPADFQRVASIEPQMPRPGKLVWTDKSDHLLTDGGDPTMSVLFHERGNSVPDGDLTDQQQGYVQHSIDIPAGEQFFTWTVDYISTKTSGSAYWLLEAIAYCMKPLTQDFSRAAIYSPSPDPDPDPDPDPGGGGGSDPDPDPDADPDPTPDPGHQPEGGYGRNDLVDYGDSVWVSLVAGNTQEPVEGPNWHRLALRIGGAGSAISESFRGDWTAPGGSGTLTYDFTDGDVPAALHPSEAVIVVGAEDYPDLGAHDGAILSVAGNGENTETSVLLNVTLAEAGTVSYDRALSCGYPDFAYFFLDDQQTWAESGRPADSSDYEWQHRSHDLGPGQHTIHFRYIKGSGGTAGYDGLFLDNLVVTGLPSGSAYVKDDIVRHAGGLYAARRVPTTEPGPGDSDDWFELVPRPPAATTPNPYAVPVRATVGQGTSPFAAGEEGLWIVLNDDRTKAVDLRWASTT